MDKMSKEESTSAEAGLLGGPVANSPPRFSQVSPRKPTLPNWIVMTATVTNSSCNSPSSVVLRPVKPSGASASSVTLQKSGVAYWVNSSERVCNAQHADHAHYTDLNTFSLSIVSCVSNAEHEIYAEHEFVSDLEKKLN